MVAFFMMVFVVIIIIIMLVAASISYHFSFVSEGEMLAQDEHEGSEGGAHGD